MKKETLADKLAKKTFLSDEFQKSWQAHMQAFGPVLEPAFQEDYQARIHLTAALNLISRQKVQEGYDKLGAMKDRCQTNADKACWLFCLGVCFEMAGMTGDMVACYGQMEQFGHRFYLPHMKLAKFYQQGCRYDKAEEQFLAAIRCFEGKGPDAGERRILSSAYTSLATCLTMMHRYEEAEAALETSRQLYPGAPGRSAASAVLYAVRGEQKLLEDSLSVLRQHAPEIYPEVEAMTRRIQAGTDELFCPLEPEAETVSAFWTWFAEQERELAALVAEEEYDEVIDAFEEQLARVFPYVKEELRIGILLDQKEQYGLCLPDYFAVSLTHGYRILLEACPEGLKETWRFEVRHYTD